MTQYNDLVEKRRIMIAAEEWGEEIKEHYAQTGEGYHITYNNGKVVRVEGSKKVIVKLPDSVEDLIDNYERSGEC